MYSPKAHTGRLLIFLFLLCGFYIFTPNKAFSQKAGDNVHAKSVSHDRSHISPKKEKSVFEPGEGGDFTLIDQLNSAVSLSDFKGKTVLLFFGFTNCPHICSPALNYINSAVKGLGKVARRVQVIFVTLDPDRDTPTVIRRYLKAINREFIGLTGTHMQIKMAADKYGVRFAKGNIDENGNYLVSHTAVINIIDRRGVLVDTIPYNTDPDEMKRIIRQHIKADES